MPTDYSLMDATLEIFLMLLAAFLLGWFFCWLIKKLFGRKPKTISKPVIDTDGTTIIRPEANANISTNRERIYSADADLDLDESLPDYQAPEINLNEVDLPKQASIKTPDLEIEAPSDTKPRPRIDLPDFNAPDLEIEDKLTAGKETLGKGLGMATAGIGAVAVGASSFKDKITDKVEDLTTDFDINTPEMPDLSLDTPEIFTKDIDVELPDITTDLETNFDLDTDVELPELPEVPELVTPSANLDAVENLSVEDLPAADALLGQASTQEESTEDSDDLTRITGIDEQVTKVLNDRGIFSYKDLQASNRTQLKEYLDATDEPKLLEIEPASWPHQATLCANRNWSKLSEYQSFLTGSNLGIRQTATNTDSIGSDDLKKIEGIGPFFESLLNDAGITSYEQLKNSDRDTLKEIIDAAGPDYRMHEPETWPYQAGLAYRGEWKKLQDYIHFMTGRS